MTAFMDGAATRVAPLPNLFPLGEVPDKPTYPYGVYNVRLGRGDAYTMDVRHGIRHGRLVLQTFGRTADGALELAEAAVNLLLDNDLPVVGWETTPLLLELDPTVSRQSEPENAGIVPVTTTFTFTAQEAPSD